MARRHQLDARLWQVASDGTAGQLYPVMVSARDGRVLDPLERQARQGYDPSDCAGWHPFVGNSAEWGHARFRRQGRE